jgi:hypothetical protein
MPGRPSSSCHLRITAYICSLASPIQRLAASMAAELTPLAQLRLLQTLIDIKQGLHQPQNFSSPEEMNQLSEELFWSATDPHTCRIESLGGFLLQILGVLAQLATSLTNGPHISAYAETYIRTATQHDDFSDTSFITFLDARLSVLRSVVLSSL